MIHGWSMKCYTYFKNFSNLEASFGMQVQNPQVDDKAFPFSLIQYHLEVLCDLSVSIALGVPVARGYGMQVPRLTCIIAILLEM